MEKIKKKANNQFKVAKTIWTNFVELVEAVSLLAVSAFGAYMAYFHYDLDSIHTILLFAASIIILLIGAKYTVEHFKKG
jgi:ABC-type amino acid transport system permease subunit